MSTYEMGIDGSSAEAGARKIVKSFDDIKAAADRMEGGVSAAARKATASFSSLSNVKGPSQQAVSAMRELSSVLRGFKGPSQSSVNSTLALLNGLKAVGTLRVGGAGVASLLSSLSGYKGPSSSSSSNTTKLLAALGRFSGLGGSARGVAAIIQTMNGYKGPSSAAVRNTTGLLRALETFKAPSGLGSVAKAFLALASAANSASAAIGRIKSMAAGTTTINVNTRSAQGAIARLTEQHNLLHSAIFKTQTLYRSLGGIFAGRAIITAANDILKITAQLEAATGSIQQARVQFGFLTSYAEKLGLEITSLSRSYGFFLGSIKGTNISMEESRQIFVGFSTAARALQLSTSDVDGVFRALGQILSKGKLQAEELRGQLGDRLPGAFVRFARALDMTKPGELDAALKKGAISGDRLKEAILEVAKTLEVEFANSADKMSKTVDAAFNRLRNSFTFAASDLGQSGMNEAIINITDALRKFLESDAFNNAIRILGQLFKLLGDNIQLVSSIVAGFAVASFAKWAIGIAVTTKAMIAASTAAKGLTAAHMALGLGSVAATGGVARLAMGLRVLWATMLANPIGIVITLIGAATAAYLYFTEATDKAKKALLAQNETMADAQNFYDAYIAKVYDSSRALDQETNSLLANAAARLKSLLLSKQEIGVTARVAGTVGGVPITGAGFGENRMFINGKMVSRDVEAMIRPLVSTNSQGETQLRYFDSERGAQRFSREAGNLAGNLQTLGPSMSDTDRQAVETVLGMASGRINTARSLETLSPDALPFSMRRVLGEVSTDSDYNRERTAGGISGDVPEGAGKGAKDSGASLRQETQDIRRALDSLRDLRREIAASDAAIASLSDRSVDVVAVQARAAAVARVDNFEDSFETVEKAHAGLVKLAQQLQGTEGFNPTNEDISTYDAARRAVENYTTSLEQLASERKKDVDVTTSITDLRRENEFRLATVEAIAKGGQAMEAANISMEVEQALIGTSIENRAALRAQLTDEIKIRQELNRSIEQANAIRDLNTARTIENDMSQLYGQGFSSGELDYYRELYTERQRLINDGYVGERLREMLALKQGQLDLADATRAAAEEEEKLRQLSIDQADAIVGAFQRGVEAGDSFLKTIGNIFKELKNILLDFVLYNPLREFLKDTFMQANSQTFGNSARPSLLQTISQSSTGAAGNLGTSAEDFFRLATGGIRSTAPVASSTAANSPATRAITQGVVEGVEGATIVVSAAGRGMGADLNAPINVTRQAKIDPFEGIRKVFDYKTNGAAFKDLAKGVSGSLGAAVQAGATAFAAFGMGKAAGKALGLGRTGSNVLGGAAAGFSVGGPVGAAIGAGVALIGSLLTAKKVPSSYSNVSVGAGGFAQGGAGQRFGKGDLKVGAAAGRAGASLFNQFALEYDATLKAGDYGSFGRRQFKVNGEKTDLAFYSATGRMKKGKPVGREGVDWIKGSDSEVQAFALRTQLNRGQIAGLSETLQTVGRNTKGTTLEEIQSDFAVGRAYDEYVKSSYQITDVARQVMTLNDNFEKLSKQAAALGLNENKLRAARDRQLAGLRKDFNFSVNQDILGITNPQLQAYNELEKEYRETVENGMAIGGDLLAVERLYGLKRVELAKELATEQTNVYKDLLTSLTASSNSPLNAETVLSNARERFNTLRGELLSGNTANIGNLQGYTENYLGAARNVSASSSGYFSIFNDVTSFLETMSSITGTADGTATELPGLPTLDAIVAEITARNNEMLGVQTGIGEAVLETGADTVQAINNTNALLEQMNQLLLQRGYSPLYGNGDINAMIYA